jgi:5-methylthioribose kinase
MNKQNYGYNFNNIEIYEDVVIKTAKNEYGKKKINYEIGFYEYILSNHVIFPMPKLVFSDLSDSILKIEYLKGYQVATKHECDPRFVKSLINHIITLHDNTRYPVSRKEYTEQLKLESIQKVLIRFNETDWNSIPGFNEITHVNYIKIKDMNYYITKINELLDVIVSGITEYKFALIHGDINLGNIMTNCSGDIRFIDPRGYFGNLSLFGIEEYDFAKLLFGLSGYNIFDEMVIENVKVVNGNIEINTKELNFSIFESCIFSEYTKLLALTIWLSNNSMYSSYYKKIYSLMIAYYICEKYLSSQVIDNMDVN